MSGLVDRLCSKETGQGEAAADELVNLGHPALAPLKRLMPETAQERRPGILAVIARIEKTAKRKSRDARRYKGSMDEIHTELMTFRGEILAEGFPLKTPYGELRIRTVDLESIQFKPDGRTNRVVNVAPGFQPSGGRGGMAFVGNPHQDKIMLVDGGGKLTHAGLA